MLETLEGPLALVDGLSGPGAAEGGRRGPGAAIRELWWEATQAALTVLRGMTIQDLSLRESAQYAHVPHLTGRSGDWPPHLGIGRSRGS